MDSANFHVALNYIIKSSFPFDTRIERILSGLPFQFIELLLSQNSLGLDYYAYSDLMDSANFYVAFAYILSENMIVCYLMTLSPGNSPFFMGQHYDMVIVRAIKNMAYLSVKISL